MRHRIGLLIAAALITASAVPAAAGHQDDERLAGVTQVVSSTSGYADLVLPRAARIELSERGVRFEGSGRLLGLQLELTGDRAGRWGYLQAYRLPDFAGGEQVTWGSTAPAECESTPSESLPLYTDCSGAAPARVAELPAGHYRLTLLTDDRPVRVTLRLEGLAGSATVQPTTRLASVQQDLPVRERVGDTAVTFGASADLGAPVETLLVARAGSTGPLRSASACVRPDDGSAPAAFGPHCPGGTAGSFSYSVGPTGGGWAFATSSSDEPAGPVGLGGSFADSGRVAFEQALGVWLARE